MNSGRGFKCYNCGKMLAVKIGGSSYEVELSCRHCKAFIRIKMKEPVSWKAGETHETARTG